MSFPTSNSLIGTVLDDKYRLEAKIGAGGFGTVYRATHLGLNQAVAVKILQADIADASPEELERFRQEGASAGRIKHPNAVTVLDFGVTASGVAYLVMELLEGHTLATELRENGTLPPARCAEILVQLCDALAEAHAEGVIHRDIKPDNIFLHRTKRGEMVKVVDFGIAKLIDGTTSGRQSLTGGRLIGTPAYMSPERLRNRPYDGKADVYSVGILLYLMLGGRVPFEATDSGDLAAVILMHVNDDPRPLRELNPSVPPEVEAVVLRALAKHPDDRPTPEELARDFAAAVGAEVPVDRTIRMTAPAKPAGAPTNAATRPGSLSVASAEAPTNLYPHTENNLPPTEAVAVMGVSPDTPANHYVTRRTGPAAPTPQKSNKAFLLKGLAAGVLVGAIGTAGWFGFQATSRPKEEILVVPMPEAPATPPKADEPVKKPEPHKPAPKPKPATPEAAQVPIPPASSSPPPPANAQPILPNPPPGLSAEDRDAWKRAQKELSGRQWLQFQRQMRQLQRLEELDKRRARRNTANPDQ